MQAPEEEKDLRLEFLDRVAVRLEKGAAEYGNANLELPTPGTAEEILEEILDLAGWSYVLWVQMRKRLEALERAADELVPNGQAPGKRHATEIQRLTTAVSKDRRAALEEEIRKDLEGPHPEDHDTRHRIMRAELAELADPDPEC